MVARSEGEKRRELTLGDALAAINAWAALRGEGRTKVGLFALGNGYLRSALGRDNQLSPDGWWGVPTGEGDEVDDLQLDASLSEGFRLIYSRRLPEDLSHWIDRADADGNPDPWVLVLAGRALRDRNGDGDGERAVELWMQAAELGNSDAIFYLARAYYKGEGGLTVDKRQGVEWWQKAAELGDAGAMRNLGRAYSEGEGGLPKDQCQSVEWWRKAAELGDAVAMTSLGVAYSEGKGGLPEDQRQAVEWFRKAADLGEEWGMFLLGAGYSKGLGGLPQDSRLAVEWYRKAAELGNATAMFYLGIAYYNGEGGLPEDKPEAVEWWHKAEETGYELSEETKTLMRAVR
jgi:TPR repeat protein